MGKRLLWTSFLATALLGAATAIALAGGGGEQPVVVRAGNVVLTVNGNASPKALPRHGLAPVSFHASGRIATADGSHPPALKEVVLDVGKTAKIEAKKFPACSAGELQATTTQAAEQACRDAIVGTGRTEVEVQFPESDPFTARGPLVIFNGGEHGGKSLLLIHAYVAVPVPTAVVVPVVMTREHKGPYRVHSVAKIPPVAGGAGSATYFYLKIDRPGYLLANCDNGHFSAHLDASFADGTQMEGSFQRPCTPLG